MTRKDYVLIATALKDAHKEVAKRKIGKAAQEAIDYVTLLLADAMKQENPAFKYTVFKKAADYHNSF